MMLRTRVLVRGGGFIGRRSARRSSRPDTRSPATTLSRTGPGPDAFGRRLGLKGYALRTRTSATAQALRVLAVPTRSSISRPRSAGTGRRGSNSYVDGNVRATSILLEDPPARTTGRPGRRRIRLVVAGSIRPTERASTLSDAVRSVRPGPRTVRGGPLAPICRRSVGRRRVPDGGARADPDHGAVPLVRRASRGDEAGRRSSLFVPVHGLPSRSRGRDVYGRDRLSGPYTGVAAIFAARCLAGLAPRICEDGERVRDLIHVRDVAAAFVALVATQPPAAMRVGDPRRIGRSTSRRTPTTVRRIAELCEVAPELVGGLRPLPGGRHPRLSRESSGSAL